MESREAEEREERWKGEGRGRKGEEGGGRGRKGEEGGKIEERETRETGGKGGQIALRLI